MLYIMFYINQLNYPDIPYITRTDLEGADYEKGQRTTIKSSGCGLCAAIMALDRLFVDYDFDIDAALKISYDTKANHQKGTDYEIFAPAFAEKFNLKLEMTCDVDRLKYCLETGGVAVAHSGGDRDGYIGVFTHGGHYVTVIGVEPDGRLAILDPSYKEGKYEEEGRAGKVEVKNGVIALCDPQVLADDTSNRDPSYYLFWRK